MIIRQMVLIGMSPGIERNAAAFDIGPVPDLGAGRALSEGCQTFRVDRIAADIDIEEIERRAETFDLQLRGLDPRLGEIGEHARPTSPRIRLMIVKTTSISISV